MIGISTPLPRHSSLRGIHCADICTCHSFNSIFSDLHKMTHHFMKLFQPRQWKDDGGAIRTCHLQSMVPIENFHYSATGSLKEQTILLRHTSDIRRKWPLLLLPRSKKNLFWSALITFETPKFPISSCAGNSTDLSTFNSDAGAGWVLWPDMKPAPTSSESPTSRSEGSELCCFYNRNTKSNETPTKWRKHNAFTGKHRKRSQGHLIWQDEKPWCFINLCQDAPECCPPFISGASCWNNNGTPISAHRSFRYLQTSFLQTKKSFKEPDYIPIIMALFFRITTKKGQSLFFSHHKLTL